MGRTHDTVISNFDLDRLESKLEHAERERDAERALADLLASSLLLNLSAWITSPDAERAAAALRVWKEARSE
jgi:hypothetical protein